MSDATAGDVHVVVATESDPAATDSLHPQQQHHQSDQPVFVSLGSRASEPASLAECARSVASGASSSIRHSTISYQQRQARAQWKGLGSRCMWEACRATFFGLFFLVSGSIIVLVGFHSELPSMELAAVNRTNYLIDPKSQKRHKLTYSYVGPVLIGMGAFILIGVGVATMEMRDMTAKVFPLTKRTAPRRKASTKSNQKSQPSRLTAEALGAMFQTPVQRVMREINASRMERCRTVATQTFAARWPGRLRSAASQKGAGRDRGRHHRRCTARVLSADQLANGHQHRAILSLGSFVSRPRRRTELQLQRRLFIHTPLRSSAAFSCPHLSTIS